MEHVRSADGTSIAVDRSGSGPALVMVVGAFCTRQTTKTLAAQLAGDFTVYEYDRRGRGDSADADEIALDGTSIVREVADLAAVIEAAGGSPFVYGHSSGALLALEAAARGVGMRGLVVFEPPYTADGGPTREVAEELRRLVAAGRGDEAASRFLALTGAPPGAITQIMSAPFWPAMVALAHTLPYDVTLCNGGIAPVDALAHITVPTLAVAGGASAPWASEAAGVIASVVPHGALRILEGQNHNVDDDAIAPVLREFFV